MASSELLSDGSTPKLSEMPPGPPYERRKSLASVTEVDPAVFSNRAAGKTKVPISMIMLCFHWKHK